ncbi:MAG TPA: DUF1003 domain-containing protein [Pyrinomonadaceae bacterium]
MSSQAMSQSEIMRKNISAVVEMQHKVTKSRTLQGRVADVITDFSGSMAFVYLHAVWFGLWILLNIGLIRLPRISEFDKYPFGLLTLIVSLEAIFLSTFVLISQNRLASASEKRAELDLQINLLAEQKATKVLEMLDQVMQQLDGMSSRINFKHDPELQALKVSPDPQEVLEVIEETAKQEAQEAITSVVEDITDEMEAVRAEVKHTSGKLADVTSEVKQIKQEVEGITTEQERISLK